MVAVWACCAPASCPSAAAVKKTRRPDRPLSGGGCGQWLLRQYVRVRGGATRTDRVDAAGAVGRRPDHDDPGRLALIPGDVDQQHLPPSGDVADALAQL